MATMLTNGEGRSTPAAKDPPKSTNDVIFSSLADNRATPLLRPRRYGFQSLVVLLAMVLAIPLYWGSLEGGAGVDAVHGLLSKLLAYFSIMLALVTTSSLYFASAPGRPRRCTHVQQNSA